MNHQIFCNRCRYNDIVFFFVSTKASHFGNSRVDCFIFRMFLTIVNYDYNISIYRVV